MQESVPANSTKTDKMNMHTRERLLILGLFLSISFGFNECKKLDGYKFPVYSTPFCPRNASEWNKRSSAINCNKTNGYTCLPNENFTELLEFCYTQPWLLIEEGSCLYLKRKGSYVDSYSCRHFMQGCHNTSYLSNKIFDNPACISIGNGCFLGEKSCKSSSKTTHRPETKENEKDDWIWFIILIGILVFVVCFSFIVLYLYRQKRICKSNPDIENVTEENTPLINGESQVNRAIFDQWEQEDSCFISTKACKEVERNIESKNLVIVAGHSGSGKSAIIQHIALKYRGQGWTVKRVKNLKDTRNEYFSGQFQKNKTICVCNDPFGKESFDDMLNSSWQVYEEDIKLFIKTAKLVMSCRSHIINDVRLARYLVNQSHIVYVDADQYKLSVNEKRQILTTYTSAMNLSEKYCDEIVKVDMHFPLLCKLYSSNEEYTNKGIRFFTEPVTVLREEIKGFRLKDKGKYCALALLVLFNDDLCVSDLLKNKDTEDKFKYTLKLCGLQESTPPSAIEDHLYSIKDYFVKKVGDTYNFYHDFVMEVCTHMFGTNYPREIVKYADVRFLRRRVQVGYCEDNNDSFFIYLSDRYIEELGERLYTELFRERLLDVVLNPCLKNEKVIKILKKKIADHPEKIQMLLERNEITIDNQELEKTSRSLFLSKLEHIGFYNDVCPLFALIVFCHTQLSQFCVNTLQQNQIDLSGCLLIFAICCNGSIELFNTVFKNNTHESLKKAWRGIYPIHIVSLFHKYQLLDELIRIGINANQKTDSGGWTPLILAAGNDTKDYDDDNLRELSNIRRDKTVQLLLSNGADINLCEEQGASPLHTACENGHNSTMQLLLRNGADINLCMKDGTSPFYLACENGHDSTVQILLNNGADINLCKKNGASSLYKACEKGNYCTVQILLSNGADINLCKKNGASPLYIACQNGHGSTVQLLLSNGADINLCEEQVASPVHTACENGHDNIVQILLSNGAKKNLCKKNGASSL